MAAGLEGIVEEYRPGDEFNSGAYRGIGGVSVPVVSAHQGADVRLYRRVGIQARVGLEVDGGLRDLEQHPLRRMGTQHLEGMVRRGQADAIEADVIPEPFCNGPGVAVGQVPRVGPERCVKAGQSVVSRPGWCSPGQAIRYAGDGAICSLFLMH